MPGRAEVESGLLRFIFLLSLLIQGRQWQFADSGSRLPPHSIQENASSGWPRLNQFLAPDEMILVRTKRKAGMRAGSMPLNLRRSMRSCFEVFHGVDALYNKKGGLKSQSSKGHLRSEDAYLSFDSIGTLKKGGEGEVKLAMDMLEPVIIERAKQVVDARHKFARKRYARGYRWEPSPGIEAAIRKAIFGRLETGRS